MFLTRKTSNWTNIASVKNSWKNLNGMNADRLAVLDAIWKKELGRLDGHCRLLGVDKGCIIVKTNSSAASSELYMRNKQLLNSLNKYFNKPWIKAIKTAGNM